MAGSAVYGAAKAGMDHYSRVVALDEAHRADDRRRQVPCCAHRVAGTRRDRYRHAGSSCAPADAGGIPEQGPNYEQQHAQGLLVSAEETARRVLAYLSRDDFGSNAVADIRLV